MREKLVYPFINTVAHVVISLTIVSVNQLINNAAGAQRAPVLCLISCLFRFVSFYYNLRHFSGPIATTRNFSN